jgi:hypothetical protein
MVNWLDCTKACLLDLSEIDLEDPTFLIPSFSSPYALEKSIERFGILNPPLVRKGTRSPCTAVLGRRRLAAAGKLGITRVHARIVPLEMTEQEGFQLAFWDNIACRQFDPACTAFVVRRLLALFPRDDVARDFLPALNVQQFGPRLERLKAIGSLEIPVLQALAWGRLTEKTAWVLSMMEPQERFALLELCKGLSLNANKTAEVIEGLFDLAHFAGSPILQFLEQEPVREVLCDRELSTQQRAARFRELVRSARFPELVARETQFHAKLAVIGPWQGVTVRPAAGFEGPECTVEVRCRSVDEAADVVARFKDEE